MSNNDFNFFTIPEEKADVRPNLKLKSKELGLVINPYMDHKIVWSESHGGRCMCDWENRKCPCSNILKDLVDYGGQCLCKVVVTKEKMEKIEIEKISVKNTKKEKTKESIENDKLKLKEAKNLAKILCCKK